MSKLCNNQLSYDLVGQIMAYESGELNADESIELIQYMIDNQLAHRLQGHYGRLAENLIALGHCTPYKAVDKTLVVVKDRLEYLRGELRGERIAYGELAELASLSPHIDAGDVELLEAAGVEEYQNA